MLREAYNKVKDRKDKDAKQGSGTCDAQQSTKDTEQWCRDAKCVEKKDAKLKMYKIRMQRKV